jgi:transposase
MQAVVERGCGLDVHQATVVACLLVGGKNGTVHKQMRFFGTTTRELVNLRDWLLTEGCTHVGMESTGVCWKPVYAVLEGFQIVVANAQHVKKVPRERRNRHSSSFVATPSFETVKLVSQVRTLRFGGSIRGFHEGTLQIDIHIAAHKAEVTLDSVPISELRR